MNLCGREESSRLSLSEATGENFFGIQMQHDAIHINPLYRSLPGLYTCGVWDPGNEAKKRARAHKMPAVCPAHAPHSSALCPDTCTGGLGYTDRIEDAWHILVSPLMF